MTATDHSRSQHRRSPLRHAERAQKTCLDRLLSPVGLVSVPISTDNRGAEFIRGERTRSPQVRTSNGGGLHRRPRHPQMWMMCGRQGTGATPAASDNTSRRTV